jgi:hypothetical protein
MAYTTMHIKLIFYTSVHDGICYKKYASARDRTTDLKIFSLTLSQLSYKGNQTLPPFRPYISSSPKTILYITA